MDSEVTWKGDTTASIADNMQEITDDWKVTNAHR